MAAIPAMLPADADARTKAFELVRQVLGSSGALPPEGEERLRQIARLFGVAEEEAVLPSNVTSMRPDRKAS